MNKSSKYFFINREIKIKLIIKSMNLAKVHYLEDSTLFFVDLNYIFTEPKPEEVSLSLAVLGGNV